MPMYGARKCTGGAITDTTIWSWMVNGFVQGTSFHLETTFFSVGLIRQGRVFVRVCVTAG